VKLPNIARSRLVAGALISLLVILVLELALSVRRETQTWDEACHIFAGYRYWTRGDFGMNPEHPPLVKLLAAAPLLTLPLHGQERKNLFSKEEDFISATEFVYTNNAEQIMFRARMAASLLTLLLAVLVFAATREMFGTKAGFVALTLFVFEPNILAHGATVTTDIGFSCFLLATVYAFYRYVKAPSRIRLILVGVAAGLALATKHSAILVLPIVVVLAAAEWWRPRRNPERIQPARSTGGIGLVRALIVISAVALGLLWASYEFRLHPKHGVSAETRVVEYAQRLDSHPLQKTLITKATQWHLLPEAYLYGLADVGFTADFSHAYLFGHVYPHGQWFYFPAAFLIKSTLALLVLLLTVPFAIAFRGARYRRELPFLLIPAFIYLATVVSRLLSMCCDCDSTQASTRRTRSLPRISPHAGILPLRPFVTDALMSSSELP